MVWLQSKSRSHRPVIQVRFAIHLKRFVSNRLSLQLLLLMKLRFSTRSAKPSALRFVQLLSAACLACETASFFAVPTVCVSHMPSSQQPIRRCQICADACMVFNVLGPSLLWLVRALQHRGVPREDVRCIARDVLQGLVLLHSQCKMVHTDLKLENILLSHGVSPLDVPAEADELLLREGALLRGWAMGNAEHNAQRGSVPAAWMLLGATMQCNHDHSSDEGEGTGESPASPARLAGPLVVEASQPSGEQQPVVSLCLQLTAANIDKLCALSDTFPTLPALPTSPGSECSEGEVEISTPPSITPASFTFSAQSEADSNSSECIAHIQRAAGPAHTIALRRTGPAPAASAAAAASEGSQPPPNSQTHEVTPWVLHIYNNSNALQILQLVEDSSDHFMWVVHAAHTASGGFKPSLRGLVCRKAAFLRVAADVLPHIPQAPLFGRKFKLGEGEQLAAAACEAGSALVPRPLRQRCWLAGLSTQPAPSAAQDAAAAAFSQAAAAVCGFCSMWPAQHRLTCAVVDLGNACDVANPFSDDIQTRQYRAPEVLIRAGFDTSADMWSMGCILFELITGDFLFNPRGGADFSCDEDHLAQMIELMGDMPKALRRKGSDTKLFFTPAGKLKNIKKLKFWPVRLVLQDKYGLEEAEAACMGDFLESMLALQPEHRCSAQAALQHPWLQPHLSHEEAVSAFASSVEGGRAAVAAATPSAAAAAAAPAAHSDTPAATEVTPPGLPGQ